MIGLAMDLLKDLNNRIVNFFVFLFYLKYFLLVLFVFGAIDFFNNKYAFDVYDALLLNYPIDDVAVWFFVMPVAVMLLFFIYDLLVSYLTFNIYVLNEKK